MSTLLVTLALAFVIIVIAIAFLAISWFVKGKSSLRPGACGRDPHKKRDDAECGPEKNSCHLCKRPDKDKK